MNHVAEARERYRHISPREYVSGEQILYLNRRYVLKVMPSAASGDTARLKGNRLEINARNPNRAKVKVLVRMWYRDRALDYFTRRIDALSAQLPWITDAPPFRLLEMTRQWGSCSPDGQIILNPHLVKAPRDCIDTSSSTNSPTSATMIMGLDSNG